MGVREIHERALAAAESHRRAEGELVEALIAVEEARIFVGMGHSSMFAYCVKELRLTEAVAANAISVARKAREVPALRQEIGKGTISISTARKFVSVLTTRNDAEWLARAKSLPTRLLEREVARQRPSALTPERAHYVNGERLRVSLGLGEEVMVRLRRAQDRVSSSLGRPATLEETLGELVAFYLRRKDPLLRARRVLARKGLTEAVEKQFTRTVPSASGHLVRLRDQDRCQYPRPSGGICGERRWVDIHHIRPRSHGGTHRPENLLTLCRAHHREIHRLKPS